MSQNNPLLADWTAPFGVAPLDAIKPEHFPPAFEQALATHRQEIDAVAGSRAESDFGRWSLYESDRISLRVT